MTTAANRKTRLHAISAVLQVMTLFSLPFNQWGFAVFGETGDSTFFPQNLCNPSMYLNPYSLPRK